MREVIGIDSDGHLQFRGDHVDKGDTTQEVALKRHAHEQQALEDILKRNVDTTNASIEAERRCIELRNQINGLLGSDLYGAFKRLQMFVHGRDAAVAADEAEAHKVAEHLQLEFGLRDVDTPQGQVQFRRLLERRADREVAKRHKKIALIEAAFGSRGAGAGAVPHNAAGASENSTTADTSTTKVHRAVRTMNQDEGSVSAQAMHTLNHCVFSAVARPVFTDGERQIQSTLDLPPPPTAQTRRPASFSTVLANMYGQRRAAELTQDYGLQVRVRVYMCSVSLSASVYTSLTNLLLTPCTCT